MSTKKNKPNTDQVIDAQDKLATPKVDAAVTNTNTDAVAPKSPGRPIVPGSKRQQILAEKEAKRAAGLLRKGRPVDPNSKKQQREQALQRAKAMGLGKPGMNRFYLAKHGLLNEDGSLNEDAVKAHVAAAE